MITIFGVDAAIGPEKTGGWPGCKPPPDNFP